MTSWVIWQDTDFCKNPWEERLYNAVVGVIYCFAFFNIKDGKSRYRASIFYTVVILENLAFVAVFYWLEPLLRTSTPGSCTPPAGITPKSAGFRSTCSPLANRPRPKMRSSSCQAIFHGIVTAAEETRSSISESST